MFLLTGANSPTKAADFTGSNQFHGYSTGTDVFADLLQSGPNPPFANTASRVLNANVGFSGAAVDSGGLKSITNEMNMGVVPNGGIAIPPAPATCTRAGSSRSPYRATSTC